MSERKWKEVITPVTNIFSLNLAELYAYRDLLLILARRDIVAVYKQTILGPLWFFVQPVLATLMYLVVFSRAAKLSTGGLPPLLFYLSGIVLWNFFSECVNRASNFLKDNVHILSKVYFPRLIVPFSITLTNLVKLGIQLLLFFIVYCYYFFTKGGLQINANALLLPVLVIITALAGLGAGITVSSLTVRYKDLSHLITFAVQLLMFVSPVIIPLHTFPDGFIKSLVLSNPMTGVIEAFRYGFTGQGFFSWGLLLYDAFIALIMLIIGIITFNAVEKSFVDTI